MLAAGETVEAWEHFHHGADIGIRGTGPSLARAFAQAGLALTATVTQPALVRPASAVPVRCRGADPEFLFLEWINALIYEMAVRRMLFSRFDLQADGEQVWGTIWGEAVDVERHAPAVEPKGATFTELSVRQEDGAWTAQCVVDV